MNEKFDKNKEETDENNRQINERLNQINERLDRNDESLKQILENNKQRDERIENNNKAVSYTHLDVYKRQILMRADGTLAWTRSGEVLVSIWLLTGHVCSHLLVSL